MTLLAINQTITQKSSKFVLNVDTSWYECGNMCYHLFQLERSHFLPVSMEKQKYIHFHK